MDKRQHLSARRDFAKPLHCSRRQALKLGLYTIEHFIDDAIAFVILPLAITSAIVYAWALVLTIAESL